MKVSMASIVSAEKQNALVNFAYVCVARDFIRLVRRMNPRPDLQPFFDELLAFLADNLPSDVPLPPLDLAELGCEFLFGI